MLRLSDNVLFRPVIFPAGFGAGGCGGEGGGKEEIGRLNQLPVVL